MFLITANARRWHEVPSINYFALQFYCKTNIASRISSLNVVARIPIDHKDFNSRVVYISQLQLANICNNNTLRLSNSSRHGGMPSGIERTFFFSEVCTWCYSGRKLFPVAYIFRDDSLSLASCNGIFIRRCSFLMPLIFAYKRNRARARCLTFQGNVINSSRLSLNRTE